MARASNFKDRFAELLKRSSKPDIALAEDLGVSKQTISAWKTGVRSPKNSMIMKISDYFGVDVTWLMGFDAELEKVSEVFRNNVRSVLSWQDASDIQAAAENGVDMALVYRVIEGTGPITLETAHQVASILGMSVGELLEENSRSTASSEAANEFVRLFSVLAPDMQTATLAAMKAFLTTQESKPVDPE